MVQGDQTIADKLRARGLSTEGTPKELFSRLMEANKAENHRARAGEPVGNKKGKAAWQKQRVTAKGKVAETMSIAEKLQAKGLSSQGTPKELFGRLMQATQKENAAARARCAPGRAWPRRGARQYQK